MLDLDTAQTTEHTASVPGRLDEMAPGPVLDAYLSAVEMDRLSPDDRMKVLRARQRMVSHHSARLMSEMAALVDGYVEETGADPDDPHTPEYVASEIRAALHMTRAAADTELARALQMRDELPQITALLESGDIDVRRLRAIHNSLYGLSRDVKTRVADAIVDDAPHLTTGQLRSRIRKLALEVEPEAAAHRYQAAVEQRRVEMWVNPDGTGNLQGSNLPPDRVVEVRRRINDIAKSLRRDGETRTMDQLRADIYLDLLAGTSEDRLGRGVVDIRVDLDTLVELNESGGELHGYGPVIADIARKTVEQNPDAEWRFMVTDPETGAPVAVDTTRRRPSADQRRFIEMYHPTCAFPGCRMPAIESDIDHRDEYSAGGPTAIANLLPLCRHDHRIRHEAGWEHSITESGDYLWRSPIGRRYIVNRTTGATTAVAASDRSPP